MSLRWPFYEHARIVDDTNELEGIEFAMYDREKQVMCQVTALALGQAKASASETSRQTFDRLKDKIGQVAVIFTIAATYVQL